VIGDRIEETNMAITEHASASLPLSTAKRLKAATILKVPAAISLAFAFRH
jgi:hypothetical protein